MGLADTGNLEEVTGEKRRIEVNWVQSAAGALAAVTSAVLLSTVGVAGTLIGAALGSIAATIGSAVYSYYINATKERVSGVSTLAVSRLGSAHARVRAASQDVAAGDPGAQEELSRADSDLQRARLLVGQQQEELPARPGWRTVLAGLPWKRIAVIAAGLFVAAMVVILAFELVTGRAISSYTGGSDSHQRVSIPGLGGGGGSSSPQPVPSQAPSSSVSSDSGTTSNGPSPSPSATTNETAVPPLTEAPSPSPSSSSSPSSGTSSSPGGTSTTPTPVP